jgi:hypothetical protein
MNWFGDSDSHPLGCCWPDMLQSAQRKRKDSAFSALSTVKSEAQNATTLDRGTIDFRRALKQQGAHNLHKLVSDQCSQDILTLLYEPRNTIHGSNLPTVAYHSGIEPIHSLVKVPAEYKDVLWKAAERHESAERWGLTREHGVGVMFEPYTYAATLIQEIFSLVDAIAAATDITGLFPDDYTIPDLTDEPPNDHVFGKHIRRRLSALG